MLTLQILFKKKLSTHQWVSLLFLTVGCMIKEVNFDTVFGNSSSEPAKIHAGSQPVASVGTWLSLFMIFLQVIFDI